MKWIVKAAGQHVLGLIPAQIADPIYHWFQEQTRGIPTDIDGQRSYVKEVASLFQVIRGKTLSGLRIVELGSGWFPMLPLLLMRQFGAQTVHTFDVNQHYSSARIAAAARKIMEIVEPLRGDPVLHQTALTGYLPDSIHYYPRTRMQYISEIPGGLADLAISRSVLEYISPECIRDIHKISDRWLTQDALWVHLVGTSDDRARQDRNLHQFDFLKYSEKEWMRISGNRYAYKNRLRLPQYRSLFQSAGWHVECEEASISKSAIAALHRIPLHPDFRRFSAEELVAGSIRFGLVRTNP
jgi:hypothetical protein